MDVVIRTEYSHASTTSHCSPSYNAVAGMGKRKKRKIQKSDNRPHSHDGKVVQKLDTHDNSKKNKQQSHTIPLDIPFDVEDRILLVGEGDFSFARSLLAHHGCTSIVATSYDSRSAVETKYPQAIAHIDELEAEDQKILYGVDVTKLGSAGGGGKEVQRVVWDRIIFNFPHVGGLTKDVNRQVRYNQELLVGFFKAALPLIAPGGSIVVTVFEGEPYELWNIRDLARHVGLKVGRSFKFQSRAYPGYHHARTLGNIEGGRGWKGEDRNARTYIFEAGEGEVQQHTSKKRKRHSLESDDDDDD